VTCEGGGAPDPDRERRRKRVVSTSVANIVLSGSSARKTAPNAATIAPITGT
jgi:hypothetical protein